LTACGPDRSATTTTTTTTTDAMTFTAHTYPDLIANGGRLAVTDYDSHPCRRISAAAAIAATISRDSAAVILRAGDASGTYRGLAPGGLG